MKNDYLNRKAYSTDLTDSQWAVIAPLFKGMREYKYSKRELVNGVLCRMKAWQTVYSFFRRAKETGLWDNILQHLVEVTRSRAGRNPNPTYAIIDSQSVDTAYKSEQVGFDGGKKTKVISDIL